MIRLIDILPWCLFIISILPEINAKIFLVQPKPVVRDNIRSYYPPNRHRFKLTSVNPEQIILHNILGIFTPNYNDKSKNKCIRLFGSIYGTKSQRQDCLKKIKQRKIKIKKQGFIPPPEFIPMNYDDLEYSDSFLDLTRYDEKPLIEASDYEISPELQNKILDPEKLRSKYIVSNIRNYKPQEIYSLIDSNLRRNGSKYLTRKSYPYEALKKRNMNKQTSEDSKSSSSSSESDEESKSEEKPTPKLLERPKPKPVEESRIPKRFQVVANDAWKNAKVARQPKPAAVETSGSSEEEKSDAKSESSEEAKPKSESSEEVKPKKTPKRKPQPKPKPEKKKNKKSGAKKEYYLQSNRIVDAESDEGFRKRSGSSRLPYFLPKRFFWDADEIQNLGFYWFNGPQGRYPHYALRP